MKKLKKFKRYDEGGAVGAGSGDPFSYTDFSDRARNLKKPEAAPIEERTAPKAPDKAPAKAPASEPAKTNKVDSPRVQDSAKDAAETSYDYPTQRDSKRDDYEGSASPTSGGQTFTASKPPKAAAGSSASSGPRPSAPKPKPPAPAKAEPSKPSYVGAGDSDDSEDTKKKTELERLKRVGSGAVESVEGPLEMAALGTVKGARMLYGAGKKAYDYFTKPAAKPAEKSEPKLETKPEPKQGELFDAKGNPTAEATGAKPAPKPAPKAEPKAETKSGAIQPTGKGPSEAGRKAMEGSKGSLKDQAKEAINKQRAADKDPRGPVSGAVKPTGAGPSEAGRKLMQQAGRGKPESLKERTQREINRQREFDKDPRGLIGGKPGTLSPLGQRAKDLIEKQREADKYPGDAGVDKVLERHSLPNKKGGKIPAFKKGGLVGRGDGCAMRGRTKGRMV